MFQNKFILFALLALFGSLLMLGVGIRHIKKSPNAKLSEQENTALKFGGILTIDGMLLVLVTILRAANC